MTITREATARSIDAQLWQAGQRIDDIVTAARHASHHVKDKVSRRADRLRASEAHARSRLRELRGVDRIAWDEHILGLERQLDKLAVEMAIAEARLKAELATDAIEFAAAVEAELIAWNTYIDDLQAIAASSHEHERQRREAVIRQVRQHRANVRQQLQQFRNASVSSLAILRIQVGEALDGLDHAASETAAEFGIA